jgi:plastocyanin
MTESESPRPDLVEEVRLRVPLPIVIPLGALAVIAAVAIGFSRILLNVPSHVAVALALVMAANVLGACAYVALKQRMTAATWAELFIVLTYPIIIGIVLTQTGIVSNSGGGEEGGGAPVAEESAAPEGGGTALTASGLAWDTDTLSTDADKPFTVTVTNEDTVVHNFSVYEDDSLDKEFLKGEDVSAGATVDEDVDALPKGEYYFQCDYHPAMNGTLTAE